MEDSTEEYRKGLGKKESFLLSSLARKDRKVFTAGDAGEILGGPASGVMHSLIRKKWVLPLKKGLYIAVPLEAGVKGAESFIVHNFVVASYLAEPYCIGFWSALNHHGLSDQIPVDTFIQTTTPRKPVKFLNSSFIFVQLRPEKIFAVQKIMMEGRQISITDPEKTVADCLDHPEHSGGLEEVARAIFFNHRELDFRKLKRYALRLGNRTIFKRLGYVLERTGLLEKYSSTLKGVTLSKGYSLLDPLGPRKGKYNERWKVIANVEIDSERWMY
ncbi:MAG: type IV toxin-antitoxin system AbiEi family antitoxin [Thermodesulfobacteriota bacterium]